MELGAALDLARNALFVTMLVCAPVVVAGVVIGLIISLLQAVTQLQDQTISIVPKIFVMIAVSVLVLPWVAQQLLEYTTSMFALD